MATKKKAPKKVEVNVRVLHLVCAMAGCTERTARRMLLKKMPVRSWSTRRAIERAMERIGEDSVLLSIAQGESEAA